MQIRTLKLSTLAMAALLSIAALPTAQAGEPAAAGERSAGQIIDDATITADIKTSLLGDTRTKGFDINVDTLKGHVTLKGGADSLAAKQAATQIAAQTKGVVTVDNRLVVAAPGTPKRQEANTATASGEVRQALDRAGDQVDDGWITSKVKTQLLADSDVSGLAINVNTQDNVVSLEGKVPNDLARAEAIRIAQQTKGVVRVKADALVVVPPQ